MGMVHFLVVSIALRHVGAYSGGAPTEACATMTPNHGPDPQISDSPYKVLVSSFDMEFDEELSVTLIGDESFMGFMLQAKRISDNTAVGTFYSTNHKRLSCDPGSNNVVTHQNSQPKSEVTVKWKSLLGNETVIFRATFVKEYSTFWTNVSSYPVQIRPPRSLLSNEDRVTSLPSLSSAFAPCVSNSAKGCIGNSAICLEQRNCESLITYERSGNIFEMEMLGLERSPGDGYIAVGFSSDDKMGDDFIVQCYSNNDNVKLKTSWNTGRQNDLLLNEIKLEYRDGFLYCRYHVPSEFDAMNAHFDLFNKKYYLLVAQGLTDGDRLTYHGPRKFATGSALSLSYDSGYQQQGKANLLVTLHASFMIVSWIGLASCGIIVARYFKQTWMDTTCCSCAVWFIVHRMLMLLTWSLTITACVLIFLHVGGWSSLPLTTNPHPLLGIIAIGLAFVQPFMALFRCHPDHPGRPVFNWLHWFVGNSAHTLAIISMFFAVELGVIPFPFWTNWLLASFVAFHLLWHVMLSGSAFRKFLLGIYMPVNWIFTTALVLLIIFSPIEESLSQFGFI